MEYLKTYENAMEKRFPTAVKLYRGFAIGIKEFKADLVCLFKVFKKVNLFFLVIAHLGRHMYIESFGPGAYLTKNEIVLTES